MNLTKDKLHSYAATAFAATFLLMFVRQLAVYDFYWGFFIDLPSYLLVMSALLFLKNDKLTIVPIAYILVMSAIGSPISLFAYLVLGVAVVFAVFPVADKKYVKPVTIGAIVLFVLSFCAKLVNMFSYGETGVASIIFSVVCNIMHIFAEVLFCLLLNEIASSTGDNLQKKTPGFFSSKATCAICGKEVGLNRFKITGPGVPHGMNLWKCPECAAKGGLLQIHPDGKVELLITEKELNKASEVKMRCNTCGHIYCYTLEDLEKNRQRAKNAALSSVAGIAGALSGRYVAAGINQHNANSQLSGIVDYEQCPICHSRDVSAISDDDIKQGVQSAAENQALPSSADELRKYKALLDDGIITQEEFDAKKKQLLGL